MGTKDFYDKYWQAEEAVPERDSTIEQRKGLLKGCLESLVAHSKALRTETGIKRIKVLDAGCGNGEFSKFMKNSGYDVVGIDISGSAIEKARANIPEVDFKVGSVEDVLPFKDGEFDVIWTTEVLEHVFDVHECLSQFNRILTPNGQLILTVPYHGLIKNMTIALFGFERHYNPDISHIRFFTKSSLHKCITRAGFKPLLWKGIGRSWPFFKSMFAVMEKTSIPDAYNEIIG